MDTFVTILQSTDRLKVDFLVLKLRNKEIPFRILNHHFFQILPTQHAVPEVQVPQKFLYQIEDILDDLVISELEQNWIEEAQSDEMGSVKENKRYFLHAMILIIIALMLMIVIFFIKQ